MTTLFEELDYQKTEMGELVLRRRRILALDLDVFEVKLGEEFLMSSLFTAGERALATLGLGAIGKDAIDVVVGGLGLGYTAAAALEDERVASLTVIEALAPVIDWHRRGLVPLGAALPGDPRCELRVGDFFGLLELDEAGSFPLSDVVLLDIDHSPRALLHDRHRAFYTAAGLRRLSQRLRPGGVFAMWSDAGPDGDFLAALADVFATSRAEVVEFPNPLQGTSASCAIYVAQKAP